MKGDSCVSKNGKAPLKWKMKKSCLLDKEGRMEYEIQQVEKRGILFSGGNLERREF
jgi:hypothetical protein